MQIFSGKVRKSINSGNDYRKTRFRDVLSSTVASEVDIDVQANQPSHLFVNSEYWGVYNIREKINEYYIDNNYSCGVSGVDLLQAYNFVEEGSDSSYNYLLDFVKYNDLGNNKNYEHIQQLMNIENFANYWIHQIYFGNTDARGNIRFWRSDSLDGRFRWILYDTDLGWGNYRSSLLYDFTSPTKTYWYNPTWTTFLIRNLLKNKTFKKYFINQSAYLLSTSLSTDFVINKIDNLQERYNDEMIYHFNNRKKFQIKQGNYKKWINEIKQLKFYALKRDDFLRSQIVDKFMLDDDYILQLNISNKENGKILLNNNIISIQNLSAKFYQGIDLPILIIPDLGYSYNGYEGNFISNMNDSISINIEFIPNPQSISDVIFNEVDYINDRFEIYNRGDIDLDLNGWKVKDDNNNIFKIINKNLKSKEYLVIENLNFGISSNSEKLFLYDSINRFVDSVAYDIIDKKISYSRNIPFDSLGDIKVFWKNSDSISMGKHNFFYQDYLDTKADQKNRNIILIVLVVIVMTIIIYLFYKHKHIKV